MKEQKPETVPPEGLRRCGEADFQWEWVEASVWTPRMLNALQEGVKGGKWHSLIDKIHRLTTLEAGYRMVRYADDMVILCGSSEEAQKAMEELEKWIEANELDLHPEKTRIEDMNERDASFEFLGYRFHRTRAKGRLTRYPRPAKLKELRAKLSKPLRRNNGKSLEELIRIVNRSLKGWFEYFKHANKHSFPAVDSWVRMRLRSILRRRQKQKGRGSHLADSKRWPNKFFETQGLFSLCRAHEELIQSGLR